MLYIQYNMYLYVGNWNNLFIIICWCVLRRMRTFNKGFIFVWFNNAVLCVLVPILKYVCIILCSACAPYICIPYIDEGMKTINRLYDNAEHTFGEALCNTSKTSIHQTKMLRESSSKHTQPTAVRYSIKLQCVVSSAEYRRECVFLFTICFVV